VEGGREKGEEAMKPQLSDLMNPEKRPLRREKKRKRRRNRRADEKRRREGGEAAAAEAAVGRQQPLPLPRAGEEQLAVDPRFADSPLVQKPMRFGPRWRAAIQVLITVVLTAALFAAFYTTDRVLAAQRSSGHSLPPGSEPPGWVLLLVPVLAIIPGAYIFLFLKYNFNH
jgi:hypothetical protein